MSSITTRRSVKCKTIDGITLDAWLFEVAGPAPIIIMTHGVGSHEGMTCLHGKTDDKQLNCVKDWSLDEAAEAFLKAGYNVLLYDPRGIGGSEGLPRNQPDPWQFAEDLSGLSTAMMGLV